MEKERIKAAMAMVDGAKSMDVVSVGAGWKVELGLVQEVQGGCSDQNYFCTFPEVGN
jgi:hypothetical protein